MAKTSEDILEVVQSLDPKNDEHWTADGLPRLDAVENLLGSDVSRKMVTNAAPDFTRAVAHSLVDELQDGEPPVDSPSVENENVETETVQLSLGLAQEADAASAVGTEQDEDDPLAEGPADVEAEFDAEIAEAQQHIADVQQSLEESKYMLAEMERSLSDLVNRKNRQFPPLTQAEAIQQFQRNEQAKRAAARGFNATSSPLDAALSARRKVRHSMPKAAE